MFSPDDMEMSYDELAEVFAEVCAEEFDALYANEAAHEQETFPTPDDDLPW